MAWANGVVPFVDPIPKSWFFDPCDPMLKVSEAMGHVSRDAWLAAVIPNLGTWLKNPVAYEAGSMTLPNAAFSAISHLSVVERGKHLIATRGLIGAFIPTADMGAYANTVLRWSGLTPGGWLGLLGAGEVADSVFDEDTQAGCPC